jgi:hypothetical protein
VVCVHAERFDQEILQADHPLAHRTRGVTLEAFLGQLDVLHAAAAGEDHLLVQFNELRVPLSHPPLAAVARGATHVVQREFLLTVVRYRGILDLCPRHLPSQLLGLRQLHGGRCVINPDRSYRHAASGLRQPPLPTGGTLFA